MSGRVINLMVRSITRHPMETTYFGQAERDITAGRTDVEFVTGDNQSLVIDWTWRGDPVPAPGSKWTLTETS